LNSARADGLRALMIFIRQSRPKGPCAKCDGLAGLSRVESRQFTSGPFAVQIPWDQHWRRMARDRFYSWLLPLVASLRLIVDFDHGYAIDIISARCRFSGRHSQAFNPVESGVSGSPHGGRPLPGKGASGPWRVRRLTGRIP